MYDFTATVINSYHGAFPDLTSAPAHASVVDVEDPQIPDSCRRPVGRSAAWWGSNKRKFIVWKSGPNCKL